jgi:transcriptional regulator GlxA family with amidase domain
MSRDSAVVMSTCPPLTPPCCKSDDTQVGKDGHGDQLIEPAASTGDKAEDLGRKAEDLGRKAERLKAVLAEIARRSCDAEFDLTDAARNLGLSRRYIQRLLEETGKSFTEHVLECRLQRVRAMLMDSGYQHMAIIDIALASGFSDVSHFNHVFRRRFGETPSSVRAAAVEASKI